MANQRMALKPFQGYGITRINGYKYIVTHPEKGIVATAYSRQDARNAICNMTGRKA